MKARSAAFAVGYVILPSADVEAACSGVGGLDRFLSPAETAARAQFRSMADSQDYAASHVLLRLLATHQLGLEPLAAPALNITRQCPGCGSTDHGRTVLPGMSLSLSRSHGLVMAAVGPASASVGVDIERVPSGLFDGFDNYVLDPRAAASMDNTDVPSRMRQWVAKEAILKAAGLGLSFPPSAVALVSAKRNSGSFHAVCPEQPLIDGLTIHHVPASATHLAAVSIRGCGPPLPRDVTEVVPALLAC
ncbi:4'-phosphopantetheinyl transferase family protein [Paenarthrobacter sp. NPDC091711]|uniref:4'-phosphopantetheinyl transferase family protein n=1 Tax=Paenarthrobacter sp. NPDC091711 TaxID=3364385 RepID=UPI003825D617